MNYSYEGVWHHYNISSTSLLIKNSWAENRAKHAK